MILVLFTIYREELYTGLQFSFAGIYFYEALVVIIMLLGVYGSIASKTVLSSVASLGVVGYGTALLFSFFSAPDLALTQFSIETLTVILLVLIVYKVPRFSQISSLGHRRRDAILSIAAGLTVTLIVFLVLNAPSESTISSYFLENSYVKAHGRNVVNVILVDFRGLDTMGEITVLTLAAIGVYTLLRFRNGKTGKTATKDS
jgi:multicomponent Na+:H+ antiporter subunit A